MRIFQDCNFSGTDLVLGMVLSVVGFPDLEVCHKILSGFSTMVGGLGSRWDLVLTLCEARFQLQNLERLQTSNSFKGFPLTMLFITYE